MDDHVQSKKWIFDIRIKDEEELEYNRQVVSCPVMEQSLGLIKRTLARL
jgi:hypothetical protein